MGTSKRRRSDRAGCLPMPSPGRPPVGRREHRTRFWEAIARGLSSEEAGVVAGVSPAVGTRWFRENGGMPSNSLAPLSGRYLSFAEREEIAIRHAQGFGIREVARRIGRCPSTIARELRRNVATRSGELRYRATTAQWHAERRASRPKVAKLAANNKLRQYVQDRGHSKGRPVEGSRRCRVRHLPAPNSRDSTWYQSGGQVTGAVRLAARRAARCD